jgi:hypothetical protein
LLPPRHAPHLPHIAQQAAGLIGYRFNTIGVSDGISMGTDGMSFSLQSRDLIADSIETVMSAQVRGPGGSVEEVWAWAWQCDARGARQVGRA